MGDLRFAVFGTSFWSRFQISAWREVGGVELVALYNRTRQNAERLAHDLGLEGVHVYDDPEAQFLREDIGFIDIITEVEGHAPLVLLAAKRKVPVICQKPMASDLVTAENMVRTCRRADVPFFIHDNFRWQAPVRAVKEALGLGGSVARSGRTSRFSHPSLCSRTSPC